MQIFKNLFVPRLNNVSFTDWVNRVSDVLKTSYLEVEESNKEDSFENVLEAFKENSSNLLRGIDGVEIFVDIYGVFLFNEYSDKKIYVLSFDKNGHFSGLPTDHKFTRVTAKKHLSEILIKDYKHTLSKIVSKEIRLNGELSDLSEEKILIERKISKVGVKTQEESGPYKFDNLESFLERNNSQTPAVGVGAPADKKSKPAAKKTTSTSKKKSAAK
jgi:hypothetical protein